jgi:hypothetical protein
MNGYIAKLDKDKTQIINVYIDRKTASIENGYSSTSALDNPIISGKIKDNHYYMLYDKCTNEIKSAFVEKNNGEPLLFKDGVGQYNIENQLVREFVCKQDCIKQLQISDKTLTKSLHNNLPYNNFYYRSIGNRVKCIVE